MSQKAKLPADFPTACTGELRGKRVAIFGASRGIGFHIASNLASKGAEITVSSGNAATLDAALRGLEAAAPPARSVSKILADFSAPESLESSLRPLAETECAFDAVILNAGVLGPSGDFAQTNFSEWLGTFNVNVFGAAKVVHFLLKHSLIGENGKIVVISGGISAPDPYFIAYSASKHALNGFAYSLAHQLSGKRIWVNSVLPGSYNTGMNQTRIERGPENIGQDNFQLSLSRLQEDDAPKYRKLHSLIEFLCSSAANGIYGRLISAQYDDWQNNLERLKNERDDLYKMLRKKE